ncbi:MAG: prepilin peptidase [Candidatus Omnitrophica bacterium]|nr:prepilin peptidase [Candidatus Omnitrophota bacterium]
MKILVFIFGAIVGSFLNVCIHRMPRGESVVWPRSRCPKCQKKIPGYDNIPFLSFILLRGKCRFCKEKISLRYPLVELITAVMFLLLFIRYGLSYEYFIFTLFAASLIIVTFVDIKHYIIPDEISIGGIILGLILNSILGINTSPLSYNFSFFLNSLQGAVAGGGIVYLTRTFFDLVYFKLLKKPAVEGETTSMGDGDIKLMAMIGAFLGWKAAILTFFIAPFLGIIAGVINFLARRSRVIPYGPFLSLASLISLFWSHKIIRFLFLLP